MLGLSAKWEVHRAVMYHERMTDPATIEKLRPKLDPFYRAVESVLIGQRKLIDGLLIGLLTDGHILLEGVPGLAKTLAVRTVARRCTSSSSASSSRPTCSPPT